MKIDQLGVTKMTLQDDLQQRLQEKPILLMTHLVLGYPSLDTNREVIRQMAENGVDCIELQIPFSEPMADGPVILKANQDALAAGIRVEGCLTFAADMVREFPQVNFLFMTYYNIVYRYGLEAFIKRSAEMGMKGFIIPDLPPEEGEHLRREAAVRELALIQLVSPTSTPERAAKLCRLSTGFVYYVMVTGITGARRELPPAVAESLQRLKSLTDAPIAAGFGISTPEQAAEVGQYADGVIVGSALVKIVAEHGGELDLPERLGAFVHELRLGLDGGIRAGEH